MKLYVTRTCKDEVFYNTVINYTTYILIVQLEIAQVPFKTNIIIEQRLIRIVVRMRTNR